jgi:Flp pilus assembly protein protease CpaA
MSTVFSILGWLCNIATLVFFVLVLIKMFQKAGVVQGILGLICGLWAFIWGWMNMKDEKFQNIPIMWGWTGSIVLSFVFSFLGGMFAGN